MACDLLLSAVCVVAGVGVLGGYFAVSPTFAADGAIQLKVVGGLAGVSQYTKLEEPFWTQEVPAIDGWPRSGGNSPV